MPASDALTDARPEADDRVPENHSFIVRLWLEERDEPPGTSRWRGRIIHYPGGGESPVHSLEEIVELIRERLGRDGRAVEIL